MRIDWRMWIPLLSMTNSHGKRPFNISVASLHVGCPLRHLWRPGRVPDTCQELLARSFDISRVWMTRLIRIRQIMPPAGIQLNYPVSFMSFDIATSVVLPLMYWYQPSGHCLTDQLCIHNHPPIACFAIHIISFMKFHECWLLNSRQIVVYQFDGPNSIHY